jgi:hypothetical protein
MPLVAKTFSVTGQNGTNIYRAGQKVDEDTARRFPRYMEGFRAVKVKHDPALPLKPSKKQIAAMGQEKALQWLRQYHPGRAPAGGNKETLQELILSIAHGE